MRVVIDASVALKWFLSPLDEPDADRAEQVLRAARNGDVEIFAPPHWMAEIVAVMARRAPERISAALDVINGLDFVTHATRLTYFYAAGMGRELSHHLFDTLYHAVAIEVGGVFLTADQRYYNKAALIGSIGLLGNWKP